MQIEPLEEYFGAHRARFLQEWMAILRFPTISAAPANDADCAACADWLAAHLQTLGFTPRLMPTAAHPLVFAQRHGVAAKPVVLLYGHYDVQPPDPLEAWQSPPFAPELRDGRVYARGAEDNKGQLMAALKAIEALVHLQVPLPTLTLIFEGDEECGRIAAAEVLAQRQAAVRADILMSCDSGTVAPGIPTITMGLRGLATFEITLHGAARDLHSGMHGGRAPNPATGLARLIATLHRPNGAIAVEGFYDAVPDPTPEERAWINARPFDTALYRKLTGAEPVAGELRFTPAERTGLRPALDVNGLHSGYGGAGPKTVIPASATAKLSVRLVTGQDPRRSLDLIGRHLARNVPAGMRLEITDQRIAGPAVKLNPHSPIVRQAQAVLARIFHAPVAFHWEGGSVPIMARLPQIAGAEPLMVGFGSEEDCIHAPNESFSVEQFHQGFLYHGLFLGGLCS